MTCTDIKAKLAEAFHDEIYKDLVINSNEIYIEVNPEKILDICVYANSVFCYQLISMYANDEKSI